MTWGEIGVLLVVLMAVFVLGRLWFRLVEGVLGGLRRLFMRKKEPSVWHTLPLEQEQEKEKK